jgi:hypothetical protein
LILLGIDIFLGGSIITVLLDEHFPDGLPYILDMGALIGLAELWAGPTYLNGYSLELQFYYCLTYIVIALLAVAGSNLYLAFVKAKPMLGAVFAVAGTIPATLVAAYFISAYVNGLSVSPPVFPVLPSSVLTFVFIASFAIVGGAMALTVNRNRKQ